MSREKSGNKNNNYNYRKKRNASIEFNAIDPIVLKGLSDTQIEMVQKPSANCQFGRFICKICSSHMLGFEKAVRHSNDISHKSNYKRSCTRAMMKYLPQPTNIQFDAIDVCLRDTLKKEIFISHDESDRRKKISNDINSIVSTTGSRILLCGSLAIGLSMVNVSDVNLYLDLSTTSDNCSNSYLSQLKHISNDISTKLNLTADIKQDKIDCGLFCKDEKGILYHISDSTRLCQLTSDLILVYMKIDERADKLMRIFRYFANQAYIDRTRDGLLPVQVFSLLVVFYLQQLTIPILPNLHKLAYIKGDIPDSSLTSVTVNETEVRYVSDISTVRSLWKPPNNNSSLAQLWVGLLRFYAVEFENAKYMVSVRCSEPVLKINRNIVNKRLAVEDPFDGTKNLMFGFNIREAEEFFADQLHLCYIYFAVPQLSSGPAFTSVKFTEITLKTMKSSCIVTPTFTLDNYSISEELVETEFKNIYKKHSDSYDVTKWPVTLFVKTCLSTILTSVFDKKLDIDMLIMLLDLKSDSALTISNYASFREYAMNLAMQIFRNFATFFENSNSWNRNDIKSKDALDVIKKAVKKFITDSLNITIPECNDGDHGDLNDEEFEMHDEDITESEEMTEDIETMIDSNEVDSEKIYPNNIDDPQDKTTSESWRLPISFQLIYFEKNGLLESSNESGVYNEHRVESIERQQLEYSFQRMPIHKTKLELVCSLCKQKGHRKECCVDVVPIFDELKFVMRDVKLDWLKKLKKILMDKYQITVPSTQHQEGHMKIFTDIKEVISKLYPKGVTKLFGSSNNGFMTRSSDIDICLDIQSDVSKKEIGTILRTIAWSLDNTIRGIDLNLILSAKVPIIKFYLGDFIQGDISVNNLLGVENSNMLKLYSDLCGEMKVLGNLIKYVSKSCAIGDASQGTLSSYAYILMLIHFLQKRGHLPVLQELYEGSTRPKNKIGRWNAWYQADLETVNKLWKKKSDLKPLEYLWLDFFYYYTVEFNIDREVVSIKQSAPLFKIDKGWQCYYLAIEDPFNLSHNLSAALSVNNFRYILQCFAHILKVHGNNANLNRKDNAHHLLMEPSTLRPSIDNIRDLNRKEIRTTTTNNTQKRTNAESRVTEGLPKLVSPFHFKQSTISNHVYIETDPSESALNASIGLKAFSSNIEEFSVVRISLSLANKSIIIPMLVAKGGQITDKLNLFENGERAICTLPLEVILKTELAAPDASKPIVTAVDSVDASNHNSTQRSAHDNKTQQEARVTQNNNKYRPITQPNITHNPVRLMATDPNFNNGPRTQQGYRFPQQQFRQQFQSPLKQLDEPLTDRQIYEQRAYGQQRWLVNGAGRPNTANHPRAYYNK